MTTGTQSNFAFIDSQNLNLSIQNLGWKLDFARFRAYLRDTYDVSRALIFIGYMEEQADLYHHLELAGYELIYKPTLSYKDGSTKGNVDVEMVMHAILEMPKYHQAVIVTGDGDFYSLINYLLAENKLAKVVVPNQFRYSTLLKQFDPSLLTFVSDLRKNLEYTHKRKSPKPATESAEMASQPQTS